MRKFKKGSIRDTNKGKISYYGFRHPLVEHSFGKYMLKHQKQADGQLRSPNNWWGGWSEDISIDSLIRHAEDLQAIHAGLYVYKVRDNGEETVVLPYPYKEIFKKELPKNWNLVSKEDCYNAIKFNCNAGLLEHLNRK